MRTIVKSEVGNTIGVEGEYYRHRESFILAELKSICKSNDGEKNEYHLKTKSGEEIEDRYFLGSWNPISHQEYLA